MPTASDHFSAPEVTRFAPSPTGHLHLGHAYSALFAERAARQSGGRFLLRVEDIDRSRCRPEFEEALLEDLGWLGLAWETPVRRQSEHMGDYAAALDRIAELLYPCFCTRQDVAREIAAAGGAPHGPEGPIYPGTCRRLSAAERSERIGGGEAYALRLDVGQAAARCGPLRWNDHGRGDIAAEPTLFGDVVLARKDVPASYHLACTVDDALQGVTLVTRSEDLFSATHVHRLIQALLKLPTPRYHHHRILADETGRRLAKRDRAATLCALRRAGTTADEVRRRLGFD